MPNSATGLKHSHTISIQLRFETETAPHITVGYQLVDSKRQGYGDGIIIDKPQIIIINRFVKEKIIKCSGIDEITEAQRDCPCILYMSSFLYFHVVQNVKKKDAYMTKANAMVVPTLMLDKGDPEEKLSEKK